MGKTALTQEKQLVQQQAIHSTDTGFATSQSAGGRLLALFQAMRPRQWVKNLALFVGIVFAQRLLSPPIFGRAVIAFVAFCLASSVIYLLNDLLDLENDRQHPVKSKRPLASGALPASWAVVAIGILLLACAGLIALVFFIPIDGLPDIFARYGGASVLFALTVAAYLLLMALYSVRLKHVVLLDVFIIASG